MSSKAGRRAAILITACALTLLAQPFGGSTPARAATPASGTIDGSAPVSWDFGPVGGPTGTTDTYALTVKLPTDANSYYAPDVRQGSVHAAVLTITLTWTGTNPDDVVSMSAAPSKAPTTTVGNATGGAVNDGSNISIFTLQNPDNDTYTLTASNFDGNTVDSDSPHAVAKLQFYDLAGQAQPAEPAGAASFTNYHIPLALMPPTTEETQVLGGRAFGEPSVGVNPKTDNVMYQAGLYTIKAHFDDTKTPAVPTYTDVSDAPLTNTASEDAILFLDQNTGRTIVSQLTLVCSLSAVSDDDGTTWTPAAKPCETPPAVDHQTIGGGSFASPLPAGVVYPDATYYCSQNVGEAECALSLDGGITYGAAVPMFNSSTCFGLHGHIKVAPDGTAYVPDKACGSPECLIVTSTAGQGCHPGFAVSTNNGASWTVNTINDGHMRLYNTGDPSIGVGAGGTMYYGYGDRDGKPKVAVCTGQGSTCGPSVDVSGPFHIANVEMATVVAGDDNRAAFAFLGSTTPGDDQQNSFLGTWHLYIAMTYDGGKTWTTTDATPDHPIQRGCIEFAASCPSSRGTDDQRNLLDFNDLTIDKEGRVIAAYTDGCQPEVATPAGKGTCLADGSRLSGLPTEIQGPALARQSCGKGLYAKFDAQAVACGLAPVLVPDASRPGALVVGALVLTGALLVEERRRRRSRLRRRAV
jgi:hypothetical protein